MLSFSGDTSSECHTDNILKKELHFFHARLLEHLGATKTKSQKEEAIHLQDMSTLEKLEKLVKTVAASFEQSVSGPEVEWAGQMGSLRKVVTDTLLKWSRLDLHCRKLTEKVFSVLHRQFNQVQELMEALGRTYVIEEGDGMCTAGDIAHFQRDLGEVSP